MNNNNMNMLNKTQYSSVGSRFVGNNASVSRIGGGQTLGVSPPRMMCYRPNMRQSDLVSNLARYVTNDDLTQTLRSATLKQTKHTTRP